MFGKIASREYITLGSGDSTYNMIRYDGHVCDHEILHRKVLGNLDYMENLFEMLSSDDAIQLDVNLYTIPNITCHLENLVQDFPNIKTVMLTASNNRFDSICYSDVFKFFNLRHITELTQHHHEFIVAFDWHEFKNKKQMPFCHFNDNLIFLRGLYWSDNPEVYMSDNFKNDTSYSHWFKSLSQYHNITEHYWDNLIINNIKHENFILSAESHKSKFNIIR